jgi:hypothetical protein
MRSQLASEGIDAIEIHRKRRNTHYALYAIRPAIRIPSPREAAPNLTHNRELVMKDETKSRLNDIFSAHEEKQKKKAQVQQVQADAEAVFLSEFLNAVESTIKPAFEEIGSYAESRGLKFRVETRNEETSQRGPSQDASVTLGFPMGDELYKRLFEYPNLTVICEKRSKRVRLHRSTIGPGRGGHSGAIGTFELSAMTPEFLQSAVADLLKEILL